ncbi:MULTISPECIES: biliverdin-producing heme oxygenase [Pseudomonas]|uniref:Biliverdin-producing heme oxygenase n=1 Tax=Pseudomonas quercus TaxID=2722792 RepID=A0ABX0YAK7_9PSED|nr:MULTISPECIES: biliverdin-producing heme oxygenase [Pseudomonas]MBF7141819.1 biliverdin-producing heme oxygenase [Pseudomonas sp. LY10J]NJP00358.1 biliverdin-producing heme oxygenase [Pseudomonas quercus]
MRLQASPALEPVTPLLRSQRLNQATHAPHAALDQLVKTQAPFDSLEGFGRFVTAQYLFQADLEGLYQDLHLRTWFTDLPRRCRAGDALADLADLGVTPPEPPPGGPAVLSVGESLGWLFVSEGSKLGAAFLIKRAEALGLSATYGARHLAAPVEGRAASWKGFTQALDALELSPRDDALAQAGALAAFQRFTVLLQTAFARA